MFNILTGISRDGVEYWFSFGLTKAKAILEFIDAIRAWVDNQERPNSDKKL